MENETLKKLRFTDNALKVLSKRYLKKDQDGRPVETPDEMLWRVAGNIAEADRKYDATVDVRAVASEFYEMMASLEFMPNSPTLMNAGRELQQLSACFVLPVEDSMESIFEAVKNTALIHKSGGGTGFSFSKLRPSGDPVGSTSGVSSGPISFMTVFDNATEAIKQGGTRRGANMGILRIDHPDIMHFITCKEDNNRLNNFNISVNITEAFMNAFEAGTDYDIISPRTNKAVDKMNARKAFDKIVSMAWKNGDPGIIFIDRINADNPTPHIGMIESTNPCGEQPLLPYESCNLGSINLANMLKRKINGKSFEIDWQKLEATIRKSVHFLDNVIDMNRYPIAEIERVTKGNRKIGLGVMGWADLLLGLKIKYNSSEAVDLAEKVMGFIQEKGREMSVELAAVRGVFPNFKGSTYDKAGVKVRNATITTIAPTGTISIISGCSSGIEPVFAWKSESKQADEILKWEHSQFEEVKHLEVLPEYFVTASQVPVEWHIKMQAAFQKYTDNAVSKTVNLPNQATIEDVADAYMLAYKLGCKGVTVYRDGSRDVQVFKKVDGKIAETEGLKTSTFLPDVMDEKRVRVDTKEGRYYIHVSHIDSEPKEVFVTVPPQGASRPWVECIARLISLSMRHGVPCDKLIEQLYKSYLQYGDVTSPLLAVNKGLLKAVGSLGKKVSVEFPCPECAGTLVLEEGCMKCYSCGFSKC